MCMGTDPSSAHLGLKVKVVSQGQWLGLSTARHAASQLASPAAAAESSACGRGNAVGLTSVFDQGQFFSSVTCCWL